MLSQYQEEHNDTQDPYEEFLSSHENVSGHDPKYDRSFCETCVVLFHFMAESGKLCRVHPESYFEPATKTKNAFCEECSEVKS